MPSGLELPGGATFFNGRLLIVDNTGDELYEIDPDGADSQGDQTQVITNGID